jgi:hypothetical protein
MTSTNKKHMLPAMDCRGPGTRAHLRGKSCNPIGFSSMTGPLLPVCARRNDADRWVRVADQEVPNDDETISFCCG